jgi:hypothetical protein
MVNQVYDIACIHCYGNYFEGHFIVIDELKGQGIDTMDSRHFIMSNKVVQVSILNYS